ncbi:hypothetical protein GCM10011571_24480 [Marinithermofilum abyssi]|jgi:hypothetical protein|uniref:Uncharacterized protein n=1 Tax=Marinithermofilum abyssi TaxID=1571185 RepID=A0A8J2VIM0_9BACL|nr:hypothetical protein [Marinithermofilum abyssi]GGE21508.1 hypothetical protein GCM10011571_24480 [Marinithermofilum abyssi]
MKAPLGLRILAIIEILYGALVTILQSLQLSGQLGIPQSVCTGFGGCTPFVVTVPYLLFIIVFIGLPPLLGGILLFFRKQWGWWLSGGYLIYLSLSELTILVRSLVTGAQGWEISAIYILLILCILLYLFSNKVREAVEVEAFELMKILGLIGLSVCILSSYEAIIRMSSI